MMGLPDVRFCCGCFSVETGAKIIAWIQLITGGLFFAYNLESLVGYLYLSKFLSAAYLERITIVFSICVYEMVQGTILWLGITKKRAAILLVWLILAFIAEIFLTTLPLLFFAVLYAIFVGYQFAAAIIYLGGIQIGVSFYLIVIVSTCRKDILRRNALFDYGVLYTPDAVEILTPRRRTGLIPTNSQFDYAALDTPEDMVVT